MNCERCNQTKTPFDISVYMLKDEEEPVLLCTGCSEIYKKQIDREFFPDEEDMIDYPEFQTKKTDQLKKGDILFDLETTTNIRQFEYFCITKILKNKFHIKRCSRSGALIYTDTNIYFQKINPEKIYKVLK